LPGPGKAINEADMVRLGFNGATTMHASLEEDIANAAAAGFDGIELWGQKLGHHSAATVSKWLTAARIAPLSINSIEDATYSPDRTAVIELCARWSRLSQEIGNPVIVVVPGVAPAGLGEEEIIARSATELRELADVAAPTRLAFELIGGQGRSVSELRRAGAVVARADRPNLGLVVDTFHAFVGGSTFDELRAARPRIDLVHINDAEDRPAAELRDSHRLFPGDGALPLDAFFGALQGYAGVVSVELFRPEYWQRDPAQVAREAFEKASAVLRRSGLRP
jgi:2-keto-myo-inositol isomerase